MLKQRTNALLVAVSTSSTNFRACTSNSGDSWSPEQDYRWKSRELNERRTLALDYLQNVNLRKPIHNAIRFRAQMNEERLKNPKLGKRSECADVLLTSLELNRAEGWTREDDDDGYGDKFDSELSMTPENQLPRPQYMKSTSGNDEDQLDFETYYRKKELDADRRARKKLRNPAQEALLGKEGQLQESGQEDDFDLGLADDAELEDESDFAEGLEALGHIPKQDLESVIDEFYSHTGSEYQRSQNEEVLKRWFNLRKQNSPRQNFAGIPKEERTEYSAWYLRDVRPTDN